VEAFDEFSQGFLPPLFDLQEVYSCSPLIPTYDELANELVSQILKARNGSRGQAIEP